MTRAAASIIIAGALSLSGCMTNGTTGDGNGGGARAARASLVSPAGAPRGEVTVTETDAGLRYSITATGLPPGPHGAHVHMVGRCDPPGFESAGGHWNPTNRAHGRENPQGQHAGDLPNLIVGTDGRGSLEITTAGALVGPNGLLDADGATFMIHAAADDLRSDPSGNSGARIACGVFAAG